ncbi:MAG: hypothetical protein IAE93_08850 [Ignavibacteria bacterium]|nr:hypothetical protein [Ignavibacteria bacterium]
MNNFEKTKEFHGLFFSAPGGGVFHWRFECPNFPDETFVPHRVRTKPDASMLCPVCSRLEEREKKIGSDEPI